MAKFKGPQRSIRAAIMTLSFRGLLVAQGLVWSPPVAIAEPPGETTVLERLSKLAVLGVDVLPAPLITGAFLEICVRTGGDAEHAIQTLEANSWHSVGTDPSKDLALDRGILTFELGRDRNLLILLTPTANNSLAQETKDLVDSSQRHARFTTCALKWNAAPGRASLSSYSAVLENNGGYRLSGDARDTTDSTGLHARVEQFWVHPELPSIHVSMARFDTAHDMVEIMLEWDDQQ